MHIIQTNIIKALYYKPKLRYSQLRPDGVESNLFQYHLTRLIKEGFIKKEGEFYTLTAKGQTYVDKLSTKNFKTREQAKIITILAIENANGEEAIYIRKHQPYYGHYSHPTGKIHFGESIYEAAERELKEKLGLKASLEHRGDVYVTISGKEGVITSILGHCFHGKVAGKP